MRSRQVVAASAAAVGLAALAVAVVAFLDPALPVLAGVASAARSVLGPQVAALLLVLLAAGGVALALVVGRLGGGRDAVGDGAPRSRPGDGAAAAFERDGPPPEAARSGRAIAGGDIDDAIAAAVAAADPTPGDSADAATVRSRLRWLAIAVQVREAGLARRDAAQAVDEGTWTDDPVAAAFLGESVTQPLGRRVRNWLLPDAELEARVERTVAAIERQYEAREVRLHAR